MALNLNTRPDSLPPYQVNTLYGHPLCICNIDGTFSNTVFPHVFHSMASLTREILESLLARSTIASNSHSRIPTAIASRILRSVDSFDHDWGDRIARQVSLLDSAVVVYSLYLAIAAMPYISVAYV